MPKKTAQADHFPQLVRLHWASLVVYIGLIVATVLLMAPASQQLRVTHLAADQLASQTTTVFTPATHWLIDLSVRLALLVVLGLSAVASLLSLWFKGAYRNWLGQRVSPLTWIALGGVVPGLMVEIAALLSGVQDLFVLKLIVGVTILSGLLGWVAQRSQAGRRRPDWLSFWLSVAAGALPWLIIAASAIATTLYGLIRLPWYVYGLYVVLIVASVAALLNLRAELKAKSTDTTYSERNYLMISLLAKTSFALVLIAGFAK